MRFRKQAAVEKDQAAHRRPAALFALPRQQFLGDRVAVVVGQGDVPPDPVVRQEGFLKVRLGGDGVRIVGGLVRKPEAHHVGRQHAIRLAKRR